MALLLLDAALISAIVAWWLVRLPSRPFPWTTPPLLFAAVIVVTAQLLASVRALANPLAWLALHTLIAAALWILSPPKLRGLLVPDFRRGVTRFLPNSCPFRPGLILLWTGILPGFALLAYLAVRVPSNNWDSMTYHMSRVGYYLQQSSLAHFQTPNVRQTEFPFADELLILWTVVFLRDELLANLVQWMAALATAVVAAEAALACGVSRSAALFTAFVFLTLPQVIFQATTTQNDLLVTWFALATLLYLLRSAGHPRELGLAAVACGLALGTKNTFLLCVPGLLAALCLSHPRLHNRVSDIVGRTFHVRNGTRSVPANLQAGDLPPRTPEVTSPLRETTGNLSQVASASGFNRSSPRDANPVADAASIRTDAGIVDSVDDAPTARPGQFIPSLVIGLVCGLPWICLNLWYTGSPLCASESASQRMTPLSVEGCAANAVRFAYQFCDWTGLPNRGLWKDRVSVAQRNLGLKLLDRWPGINDDRWTLAGIRLWPTFPYLMDEDHAWFGPNGLLCLLPGFLIGLGSGLRRRDWKLVAAALPCLSFMVAYCLLLKWQPWACRLFCLPIGLSLPVVAAGLQRMTEIRRPKRFATEEIPVAEVVRLQTNASPACIVLRRPGFLDFGSAQLGELFLTGWLRSVLRVSVVQLFGTEPGWRWLYPAAIALCGLMTLYSCTWHNSRKDLDEITQLDAAALRFPERPEMAAVLRWLARERPTARSVGFFADGDGGDYVCFLPDFTLQVHRFPNCSDVLKEQLRLPNLDLLVANIKDPPPVDSNYEVAIVAPQWFCYRRVLKFPAGVPPSGGPPVPPRTPSADSLAPDGSS